MEEIKRKRASLRKTPEKSHNTTAFMTPELITAEEASANLEKELKKALVTKNNSNFTFCYSFGQIFNLK